MTVSTSRGSQLTVDDVVLTAYQTAGLMSIDEGSGGVGWTNKTALAHRILDTILDELQTYNIMARPVIFRDVALTSGTYVYAMQSDVLDVVGDGMYIDPSNTDLTKASGETIVKQIDREAWQRLSSKNATGRPTQYYVHRVAAMEIKLWPIPDEAGTIRFQVHQLLADTYDGSATIDLRNYWMQYLIWELAHQLAVASSLEINRCSYLQKRAREKRDRARSYSSQHPNNYVYVNHSTPWTRGRR
jgi:hypothetical protein